MSSPLLLLRRRGRRRDQAPKSDDIGLLDTLTNVVGVMALITALLSIFAATSSLNIQAPMARRSPQGFHLLVASAAGIWDLQPAATQMLQVDRERVAAVKRCTSLQKAAAQQQCNAALDGWSRQQLVGPIRVTVNHGQGSLQRVGPPTVPAAQLKGRGSAWLDTTMAALVRDKQAVFVVLESDGFATYRAIKANAQQHGVHLGWEPWTAGTAINFWSNAGRRLTVQ